MKVGGPHEEFTAVDMRAMQTRRFDTLEEQRLLLAAIDTLQDLGFTISETSSEFGVLVASKQRDAEEGGQVVGAIMMTLVLAAFGTYHEPTWDKEQSIHVTLVSSPIENAEQTNVRVSFDRRLTNNHGRLWKTELITDPKTYQEFFEKLSQSAFLEANQ